jgi:fatty acid desaturase
MEPSPVNIYEIGEPLPTAVLGNPSDLSESDQQAIRLMSGSDPGNFLGTLALTWMLIVLAIAAGIYLDNWFVNVAVICFIATRQNVLGLLTHEQVHRNGMRSQLGDLITNLFCAFPILISLQGYRRIHLTHHRKYFSDLDPDYRRKQGKEWTFPQSARAFFTTLFCDLIGLSLISTVRGKAPDKSADPKAVGPNIFLRLGYYGVIALALVYTNTWIYFLLFWIIPIATVLQVIVRWGAICEHRYNLVDPSIQESTPLITPRWWEALLMPNLNFNLHVYHHWYPTVPFKKLPQVHRIFVANGLIKSEHVFDGYVDYLMFLVGKGHHAVDKATAQHQSDVGTLTMR